jgi:hypothetical protein
MIGSAADFHKSAAAKGRLGGALQVADVSTTPLKLPANPSKVAALPELVREGHALALCTCDPVSRSRVLTAHPSPNSSAMCQNPK